MQLFNKESAKKTFAHTWYIYPLTIGLITLVWIWGFQTFHLPSLELCLSDNRYRILIRRRYRKVFRSAAFDLRFRKNYKYHI